MPRVTFCDGDRAKPIQVVEPPVNATLLDALKLTEPSLSWRPLWNSRWRSWLGREPAGGEPLLHILSGHEGLTPPSAYEVRRFGDDAEKKRLASQAGLLRNAVIEVSLQDPQAQT
ncbi:MAG: hypothetical protein V3W41_08505 [Planctomycetota bacterium]